MFVLFQSSVPFLPQGKAAFSELIRAIFLTRRVCDGMCVHTQLSV